MNNDSRERKVHCRDCGAVIDARAEICPECGIRQKAAKQASTSKDPGLAAVASFIIPGLGQVYNGQIAKGIVAGVIVVGLAITVVGLVVAIPLWLYLVYDAYKVAESYGTDPESRDSTNEPLKVRMTINEALRRYQRRTNDTERVEDVRKRFGKSKLWELSEEDKEFILERVEEYNGATGRGSVDEVRDGLGM